MDKKKVIILCAVIAASACLITGLFTYFYITSQERGNEIRIGTGNYDDIAKYMEISDLEGLIKEYYYQDVEEDALVSGALEGMVDSLGDPYSAYYPDDEYSDFTASNEGTFVGVGMHVAPVSQDLGYLRVVSVYGGGPAESAGVLNNDLVVAVDGIDLRNLDFDSAQNLISGPSGSDVTLTVATDGVSRDAVMKRAEVPTPSVSYSTLDDRIGEIIISDFNGDCVKEFEDSLAALIEEEEVEGIVIDIRDNMNGTAKSVADILDMIMPEGIIGYSIDKNGDRSDLFAKGEYNDIPIAVIVNGATGSASELFAGAVQDGARGQVIGTQTFGKGVAQTILEMPYSGGGVKLTTSEYFTPLGNTINGVGITPDVVVEMPEDTSSLTAETDPQILAAMQAIYEQIGEG